MESPVQRRIPVIGIVGGIGSGKSAVANWVADKSHSIVVDADKLGHAALTANNVKAALVERFGPGIRAEDGSIIRSVLAKQVFGEQPEQVAARRDLEQVVHPEIGRRIADAIAQAGISGFDAVLLDAAVLMEADWRKFCDLVVYIDTPDSVRLSRIKSNRSWTEEDLRRREASQLSLSEKRRQSDVIVANDRDLESAGQQLVDVLAQRNWIRPTSK